MTGNMFPPVSLWPWRQFPCFIHENTTEQTRWGLDGIGLCFWHRVSVRYPGWPRTCSLPSLVSWVAWPLGPDLQDEISFKVSALVLFLHYRLFCLLLFSFNFFYFMCVFCLCVYICAPGLSASRVSHHSWVMQCWSNPGLPACETGNLQLSHIPVTVGKLTVCFIFSTWNSQYLTFGSGTLNNPQFSNGDLRGTLPFPPSPSFLFLCPPAPCVHIKGFSMCLHCEYSKPIILNMNWWLHAWTLSFSSWNHGPLLFEWLFSAGKHSEQTLEMFCHIWSEKLLNQLLIWKAFIVLQTVYCLQKRWLLHSAVWCFFSAIDLIKKKKLVFSNLCMTCIS